MIRPFALHSREQVGVDRGYRCRDARTPFAIDRLYARPSHQPQIPLRQGPCDVIDARTTQIQQPCLALHGYLAIPLNHRFPLGGGEFPSALFKKGVLDRQFADLRLQLPDTPLAVRGPCISAEDSRGVLQQLPLSGHHLGRMDLVVWRALCHRVLTPGSPPGPLVP